MYKALSELEVAIIKGELVEEVDGWYAFPFTAQRVGPFNNKEMAFNYLNMLNGTSDKLNNE